MAHSFVGLDKEFDAWQDQFLEIAFSKMVLVSVFWVVLPELSYLLPY